MVGNGGYSLLGKLIIAGIGLPGAADAVGSGTIVARRHVLIEKTDIALQGGVFLKGRHVVDEPYIFVPQKTKVQQRSTYTATKVENQKTPWPPQVFQNAAKHPEGKHIAENMEEAAMHEHMGEQLPGLKQGRKHMVQGKSVGNPANAWRKVATGVEAVNGQLCQKDQPVYDEQVFYDNGQDLEPARTKFSHAIMDGNGPNACAALRQKSVFEPNRLRTIRKKML